MRIIIQRAWAFLHRGHFLPAVVIASLLFIVEQHHYLDWVDAAMLQVSQRADGRKLAHDPRAPVVVGMTDVLYEREFRQASPLDRAVLADVLDQILQRKPRVLAIDIDLSPGPAGDAGQKRLDDLLRTAAKPDGSTQIIAITPQPVSTPELLAIKGRWLREMCMTGIRFATPAMLAHMGSVLKYESHAPMPSLGAALQGDDRAICRRFAASDEAGALRTLQTDLAEGHRSRDRQLRPINFNAFDRIETVALESRIFPQVDLAGRAVFVGGAYGRLDEHLTPAGEVPGVLIHAAVAYSTENRVSMIPHAMAVVLDVLLGMLFGSVFAATWGRYFHARSTAETREYAFFWLLLNFCVLIFGLLAVLHFASWLLRNALWLNPAPMLLGMFIDTLLAKEPHHDHGEAGSTGRVARWLWRIRWSLAGIALTWALWLLIGH